MSEQVEAALPDMFALALLACGSRPDAQRHVAATLRALGRADAAVMDQHALLARLVATLETALGRRASQRFVVLDDLLRVDASREVDLEAPPIAGRLGVALAAGFVDLPPGPAPPPDSAPPARQVGDLYRSLAVQLDERLRGELLAALSDDPVE